VQKLLGEEGSAARVGPDLGFSATARELRNMYARPPAQPGLWFIAGSLAQCRINSKYPGAAGQGDRGKGCLPARKFRK